MLPTVLEIIGAIWLLTVMALLLFIVTDIAAARSRKYFREYAERREQRRFDLEFAKIAHPAGQDFVSGEWRK